jgi:antitoxin CcdA
MRRGEFVMKPAGHAQSAKRPFNLLLNQATVQQARIFTPNLSSTVDLMLADSVSRQQAAQQARRQLGDAVVTALDELFSGARS